MAPGDAHGLCIVNGICTPVDGEHRYKRQQVGSTVHAYEENRWWPAEVIALESDDMVRIHFLGWDTRWDRSVRRGELQVDATDGGEG